MSVVETRSPSLALEHLLEAVEQPVLVVDAANRLVRSNAAGRALFPSGSANLEALRAFAGPGPLLLLDPTRPAGEPVAFEVDAGPLDGAVAGRLLVLRDPRGRLSPDASHELRTPLTAILGYTGLLLKGLGGGLSPKQQDKLQRVRTNGERMLRLIDDLRA